MAPKPVEALCDQTYTAVHTSGVRKPEDIIWICLHSTEGEYPKVPTAESVAVYFTLPTSGGSAHIIVDDDDCYRTLRNIDIPWAAPGANTAGWHIEMCGYARWSAVQWKAHDQTLRRSAYKAALHANFFGIPLRWVNAAGLRAKKPGITTHADVTKAFPWQGTHTDPGAGFPRSLWMTYAKAYAAELAKL